jgi:polysaccharide biosynthesis/export protein
MYIRIAGLFIISALMTSCISQKDVTYFQPKHKSQDIEQTIIPQKFIATIQPGDIIGIRVSSISPEANGMFNPYAETENGQQMQAGVVSKMPGYQVDDQGSITLPLMGKLNLGGLSTKEANVLVSQKLEKFLVDPTVNVRILNYKISILGEVARPSVYNIPDAMISLPEALGMAGDLTVFGKRKNILIIRENDGKRTFARVDLTQRDIFNSPYYYLQPNDVVYVEPSKGKLTGADRALQLTPVIMGILSFVTVLTLNFLR